MCSKSIWGGGGRARSVLMAVLGLLYGIATMPVAGLQEEGCGERASLTVRVLDDSGAVPIPAATVVLRWTDADRRPVREAVDADGRLLLCAPEDARRAVLWAEFGDASSEEARVALESGVASEVELRMLFAEASTGRILGRIMDMGSDRPVAAARVTLTGRAEAITTNRRGYFALSGLPVGDHELSVTHIGYAPLVHPVTVTLGRTTEALIGLSPDPVELEPLVATVTRSRRLEVRGFYERKYWGELLGGGHFFTVADIERRNPARITHMIADVPGVRLGNCGLGREGCQIYGSRISRGFMDQGCKMNVFVDGNLVIRGSDERWAVQEGGRMAALLDPKLRESINDYVLVPEIAAIEVYTGAASIPAEFSGFDARCGAVVIWTG